MACGESTTLNQLFEYLRENLTPFDPAVAEIEPVHGPERPGDIPHSLASIEKARRLLGYRPEWNVRAGLAQTAGWYFQNLKPLR